MQIKWCKQFCRSNCMCLSEFPKPYCYCLLAVISTSADLSWIREDLLISTCQNKCFQRACTLLNWSSLILSADILPWGDTIVMAEGSEFDLDYITERIIGIAFHQSCTEQTYQHNLRSIMRMLQSKHADRYMVSRQEKQANQLSLCVFVDW